MWVFSFDLREWRWQRDLNFTWVTLNQTFRIEQVGGSSLPDWFGLEMFVLQWGTVCLVAMRYIYMIGATKAMRCLCCSEEWFVWWLWVTYMIGATKAVRCSCCSEEQFVWWLWVTYMIGATEDMRCSCDVAVRNGLFGGCEVYTWQELQRPWDVCVAVRNGLFGGCELHTW